MSRLGASPFVTQPSADRRADAESQALVERVAAEARTAQRDAVSAQQFASGNVAAIFGPNLVVGSQIELISGLRAQTERGLDSGRENPVDEVRLAVAADDERGLADEVADALRAVGRRYEGVAGHARIRRVDPIVVRAGMPLLNRAVVLQAGVGALPGGHGDLLP